MPSKPITTRFGLSSAPPGIVSITGDISIMLDQDCNLSYAQIFDTMAESTAYAIKSAMRSRLMPSDEDLRFLTEKAKAVQEKQGDKYARDWLVSFLDPQKYSVNADFSVSAVGQMCI